MNKKAVSSLVAAAALSGAALAQAVPALLNPYRVHQIDLRVDGEGKVHRSVSAHRGPLDGVSAGECDDVKAQARLKAEIAAAESECTFR